MRTRILFLMASLAAASPGVMAGEGDDIGKEFGYCSVKESRDERKAIFSTVFYADFVDFYGGYMSDKTPDIARAFGKYVYAYRGVEGSVACYRRADRQQAEDALLDAVSGMRREGEWDVDIFRWRFRG